MYYQSSKLVKSNRKTLHTSASQTNHLPYYGLQTLHTLGWITSKSRYCFALTINKSHKEPTLLENLGHIMC